MQDNAPAQRRARTDLRTRDIVDEAIASIPTLGLAHVAEYLAAMNVPHDVAVRALVYPEKRRQG